MPNFVTPINAQSEHAHAGPEVEMANPGLWFLWDDLVWAQMKKFIMSQLRKDTFSFAPSLFRDSQGCPSELSNQLCVDFSFPVKGNSCTSQFVAKQCSLIAWSRRRQTVQSTAPGDQSCAQNWVSLSWLSCSREHSQGEARECFPQAGRLSGNTDFHLLYTLKRVDIMI